MVYPTTAAQSLQNESTDSSSRKISSTASKSSPSIFPRPPPPNALAKAIPSPRATSCARARSVSTVPELDEAEVASLFRQTLDCAQPAELPSPMLRATELGAAPPPPQRAKPRPRPRPRHVEWSVPHPPSVPSTPMRDASPMSTASWGCPESAAAPSPLAEPVVPRPRPRPRPLPRPLNAIPANAYSAGDVHPSSAAAKNSQGQAAKSMSKPVPGSTRPVGSSRPAMGARTGPRAAREMREDRRRPSAERAAPARERLRSTKRKQPEDEAGGAMATNTPAADEPVKRARTSTERAGNNKLRGTEVDTDTYVGKERLLEREERAAVSTALQHMRTVSSKSAFRITRPPASISAGNLLERVEQHAHTKALLSPLSTAGLSQPPARPRETTAKAQPSSTTSVLKLHVSLEDHAAARLRATSTSAGASKALPPSTSGVSQVPARPQASGTATASTSTPPPIPAKEPATTQQHSIASLLVLHAGARLRLEAAQEKLSTQTAELQQVRLAAADEATRRLAAERTVAALRTDLEAARRDFERSWDFEQERDARARAEAAAAALRKTVDEQVALLQAEREGAGKLRADLEASRACTAAVGAELKEQRAGADTADDALKAALADATSAKDDKARIEAELQNVKAELHQQRAGADAADDALKTALADARSAKDELRCTSDTLHRERETSAQIVDDKARVEAELQCVKAELHQQRAGADAADDALKAALANAKSAKEELHCTSDTLQREHETSARTEAQLERMKAQLGQLSGSYDTLTLEHEQRQQELAIMKTAFEAAKARANEAYGELSEERVRAAKIADEHKLNLERQLSEAKNECETVRRELEADLAGKTQGVSEDDTARLVHIDALKRQNFKLVAKLEDITMENRAHAHSLKAVWDAGQALLASLGAADSESTPNLVPSGAYGDIEAMMRRLSAMKQLQPEYNNMRATLEKAKGSLAEERKAKEQMREAARQERAAVKDATERCHRAELAALEEHAVVRDATERCHRAEMVALEERKRRQEAEHEAAEERKRRADVELVVHEVGHAATLAAIVKM